MELFVLVLLLQLDKLLLDKLPVPLDLVLQLVVLLLLLPL